jgi:hypothetical protein
LQLKCEEKANAVKKKDMQMAQKVTKEFGIPETKRRLLWTQNLKFELYLLGCSTTGNIPYFL